MLLNFIMVGVVIAIVLGACEGRIAGRFILGVFISGFVGFLLRPSANLVGQLPFGVVITRGATLSGVDELFRGTAEISFNYMLAGAILGVIIFIALGILLDTRRG